MRPANIARPTLSFLDTQQCSQIHESATEVLRKTGVCVHHEEAQRLLADAGCIIAKDDRVFIPPSLVEWALRQPPGQITLCAKREQ